MKRNNSITFTTKKMREIKTRLKFYQDDKIQIDIELQDAELDLAIATSSGDAENRYTREQEMNFLNKERDEISIMIQALTILNV